MKNNPKKRRFELAPSIGVSAYSALADEFLERIFGLRDFLITDESSVYDFCFGEGKAGIRRAILEAYGVDISEINNLLEIFQKITSDRNKANPL